MKLTHRCCRPAILAIAALACSCVAGQAPPAPTGPAALFSVADAELPHALTFVAYGDMRFTATAERDASLPAVREALVAKIAAEHPAALFLTGDIPWHGGTLADYGVYRDETGPWREAGLRVYPALGNHEFSGCEPAQCLDNWWSAFPEVRGHRWYAVALGSRLRALALDSDAPLTNGAPQRLWLESELGALAPSVKFVLIWLHHPPVADLSSGALANHNPRPNEVELADYLSRAAPALHARVLVIAGHTHNYERFEQDGITYLVSGGGGAHPYEVERSPRDLYQGKDFPNFHYLRFRLTDDRLSAEMVRVTDPDAATPQHFEVRDRFEIRAR
jgi:hypothetical protein